MTINDALRNRVRFVRLTHWAPTAHIELPLEVDGHGPWAIIRDPSGEQHIFISLLQHDGESGYEARELPQKEQAPT